MARRGTELRDHILWTAKDVFLETGFERASMDGVAARAETSKRSLYAHFESKERLFLAVIGLVRGLFLARLGEPGGPDPAEALVLFCARYLEGMLYEPTVRMVRISMAEAERFPEQAAQYHDVLFAQAQARLGAYLAAAFAMEPGTAEAAGAGLLGRVLHPLWTQALFGLTPLVVEFGREAPSGVIDLDPIRVLVAERMGEWRERTFPAKPGRVPPQGGGKA